MTGPVTTFMDPFFIWLESTAFSTWIRESPSVFAFPAILSLHTIGMGLVAGINLAIALRILGAGSGVPLKEMKRFLPVMWSGFWLNAASGVALLIGYPTKALTNPVFYLKLSLIAVALGIVTWITRQVLNDSRAAGGGPPARARLFACASLACWVGAITAGRLLAYTYSRLMAVQ
jgi:hypothetical protein